MAVLALQQLSEASDSIERYKSLKRIGATRKMIDKTIFIQTVFYFSLPVILALIHSVTGIYVVNNFINLYENADISFSAFMTALIFIVIYAGYFYTTYIGYKNIVKAIVNFIMLNKAITSCFSRCNSLIFYREGTVMKKSFLLKMMKL